MQPCQDVFGCSATQEGGFAGRAEAVFTSIESQKAKGSLHAHSQVFVQCPHQRMPLIKVFEFLKSGNAAVVQRYLRYKTHVCRQAYADQDLAERRLPEQEAACPQYKESKILISRPSYVTSSDRDVDRSAAVVSVDSLSTLRTRNVAVASVDSLSTLSKRNVAVASVDSLSTLSSFDAERIKKGREWLQKFLEHI